MDQPHITIRRAESQADYRACQEAQRRAWGIVDDDYVVPIATLVGAQLHGGLVLGAFLDDGEAVGLSFAFLGRSDHQLCLYSQLTGIVPRYQDKGLGRKLKLAQREFALAQRISTIAWAFDPLQAGNARFNLDKLGATSKRYVINMYGPRSDQLNRGVATDRLIVHWSVATGSFERGGSLSENLDLRTRIIDRSKPEFLGLPSILPDSLLLEIPFDINTMRSSEPLLADRWSLAVREAFLQAFEAGYVATNFIRDDSDEQRRFYYRLVQEGSAVSSLTETELMQ